MHQVIGGKARTTVAGGLDGPRRQEVGRLGREREQASHRRAVHAILVSEGHPSVAQQVQPRNGRRPLEERLESIAVEVLHGGGEHRLLVEHVLAASLLEEPGEFRRRKIPLGGPDPRIVAPTEYSVHI